MGGGRWKNREMMIDDLAGCNITIPEGVTLTLDTVTYDYQCRIYSINNQEHASNTDEATAAHISTNTHTHSHKITKMKRICCIFYYIYV